MKSNILIIEDEAKIARFVELELSHEGYVCDKAEDGRKGLEMAESGAYDLVLLDIMLPELNGLEVLRRLRKTNDVPVIVLTARDAVMDKVSGLDMGADDYVTKPFAIEELLARIRLALRRGGAVDLEKASSILLDDFRSGRIGRITLEAAPDTKKSDDTGPGAEAGGEPEKEGEE